MRSKPAQGKQPRTVHIDVYCTGSDDADDSGSSASSGSDTRHQPRTVFESEDVRVLHRQAGSREQPLRRRRSVRRVSARTPSLSASSSCVTVQESPSVTSTKQESTVNTVTSSRPTITDSVSSFSTNSFSVPSSLAASADTVASSWKETDTEALRLSGMSLEVGSSVQNDSFEYADSADRERILRMAERWSGGQNQSYEETMERRLSDFNQARLNNFSIYPKKPLQNSTDSLDDDDASEMGWTFSVGEGEERPSGQSDSTPSTVYRFARRSVLGPFGTRPPSPRPATLEDTRTKPFAGAVERTECFVRAEKFGVIVNSLKKPGHHVGPAKNPDCSCFTCQQYFEERRGRGRTRSVGDLPAKGPPRVRDRLSSCERDSICSQFSYLKDLV